MSEEKENPDFRFLVRLQNTDLNGKKKVIIGLTGVPGINNHTALVLCRHIKIDPWKRLGDCTDAEIEAMQNAIENVADFVPEWMRNRRFDPESGDDLHLVGSEIQIQLREDLNRLKKIRSWRGLRHEKRLPTRGQRTKNNGRTGMTVGVQRKKE